VLLLLLLLLLLLDIASRVAFRRHNLYT